MVEIRKKNHPVKQIQAKNTHHRDHIHHNNPRFFRDTKSRQAGHASLVKELIRAIGM